MIFTAYSRSVSTLTHVSTDAYAPWPNTSPFNLYRSATKNIFHYFQVIGISHSCNRKTCLIMHSYGEAHFVFGISFLRKKSIFSTKNSSKKNTRIIQKINIFTSKCIILLWKKCLGKSQFGHTKQIHEYLTLKIRYLFQGPGPTGSLLLHPWFK